jgi:two-component system phosphate regulon sensor histidine kinase PhoR
MRRRAAGRLSRGLPLLVAGGTGLVLLAGFGAVAGWVLPIAVLAVVCAAALPPPEAAAPPVAASQTPAPRTAPALDPAAIEPVLDAVPEPVLLLDADGTLLIANTRALSTHPTLRRGNPLAFAMRAPELIEAVRTVAETGEPRRVEFSERVPVERYFSASVTGLRLPAQAPVLPAGRRPGALIVVLHDVSQARRLEQMRVDFVANASHELRTPLASLSGFIETLQGPARNDAAARERFLAIMHTQARRMARLIEDLLSLSRIELNAHVRPATVVEIGPLLGLVIDTLAPLAQDRGIRLELVDAGRPLPVAGDRDELIRVFENLVENALKYGTGSDRVMVSASRAGEPPHEEAVVSVTDFGPGIAPEHVPRLTERFYRVSVTASREQGGTGLGLAIVKHILNRHRGRLLIDSAPGRGATFTVRLDIVRP